MLATLLVAQSVCAAAASATPQIKSINPSLGSVLGGQQVTINGSGFRGRGNACASKYDIWFGTDLVHRYAISPSSYQVLTDSQIKATVPANFGGTVDVRVYNACGATPISTADQFTYAYPATQCVSGTCSISIGSKRVGPLAHDALGLLDGVNTDSGLMATVNDGKLIDALHPRQWRLGQAWLGAPSGGVFGLARHAGAQISVDLTSDWMDWAWNGDHARYATPYGALSTYYSFIYNDVKHRIVAGQVPQYFDIWNEPVNAGTVNQWLSVYGTAYRAIKAADPTAQVVGPSLAWPLLTSTGKADTPGQDLSLTDFLNWEVRTGYRLAAVTYHEDGTTVDAAPNSSPGPWLPTEPVPGGYHNYWSPAAIATHVSAAKALIGTYRSLAGTKLFVNEYGPSYADNVPGWMVGDFASLENAGVDQAMLTCPTDAGCSNLFDGLIGWDGAPQMPYWVMRAYSQESGTRLQSSSSGSNWYTLATRVAGAHTIEALVGRADDCWGGTQCPQFHKSSHPAAGLSLSVAVPWSGVSAVDVNFERMPDSATSTIGYNDVATAPAGTTISRVRVRGGIAQVRIPSVGDGDAIYLTVSPSASGATNTTSITVRGRGSAKRHCPRAARTSSRHPRSLCRARMRVQREPATAASRR